MCLGVVWYGGDGDGDIEVTVIPWYIDVITHDPMGVGFSNPE